MQPLTLKYSRIKQSHVLFFTSGVCFLLLLVLTGIPGYFWSPPQGIHFSRHIDSFSYSYYYFSEHSGFFHPGNFNLESINGRCASEFPIMYYITSLLYLFFGVNFWTLKIITILMLFLGFLYCVKMVFLLCENLILSVLLTTLFFTSTVILYYGTFYLPDIHALGFLMVSLYYFFLYFKFQEKRHLLKLYIFITLSALLKASFFYYGCIFLVMILLISKREKIRHGQNILFFFLSLIIIASWYVYANRYNFANNAWYYTLSPKPFWKESRERITLALGFISNYWYSKYYFQSTFHFFFLTFLLGIFYVRKISLYLVLFFSLISLSLLYASLFLTQFIHHDYYFIAIVPAIIIIVTLSLISIVKNIPNKLILSCVYISLLVITILSANYAKLNLHRRYSNNFDSFSAPRYLLYGANDYLDSIGVSKESKFLVIGDRSQNGSLAFLRRFGWIYPNFQRDTINRNTNLKVADYLVVLRPSVNTIPKNIQEKLKNCDKYVYYNNYIYSLKNYK
ncbi:MAG: glycosyltransferase family 39 protein [Chitinophagaceae bacterium]|nr:glycosyltransferase family 39 protein [Chitinophagaceae bacterium]